MLSRTELGPKYEKHIKFCAIAIYENAFMCYWLFFMNIQPVLCVFIIIYWGKEIHCS